MTTVDQSAAQGWIADDSTFGARLALVRQRMGWGNVKEAAVACGLPVESWRSWERDGRTPQRLVDICSTIAAKTGCDLGWLIAGRHLQSPGVVPPPPLVRSGRRRASDKHLYISLRRSDEHEEKSDPPARPNGPSRPAPTHPVSAVPARSRRPQPTRPGVRPMSR